MKLKKEFVNSIYNLFGLGLPLVFAVFSIPLIIKNMGDANFGLLTLVWAVVSYFGLFDLGLGRALTQQLSIAIESDFKEKVPEIIFTAVLILFLLGCFAGVLMYIAAPWGVELIKEIPDRQVAINSMYYMAWAMPAIVLTSGFRGILEANHSFGIVNAIRIPMGVFTFLGPLVMVLFFSSRLDNITAVLSFGRVVACFVHMYFALRCMNISFRELKLSRIAAKNLCSTGGWITVSNVISPLMGYADRFLIGLLVSSAAVAYYTTPQEMVTKIWIIPGAITTVIFPLFAALSISDELKKKALFINSIGVVYTITLPICAFVYFFSYELLSLWLNYSFANKSYILLMVFSFGILINCLAHIPYTYLQSVGRANSTALIHIIEFPFYIVSLWFSAKYFAELGVAIAWLFRIMVDTMLMYVMAYKEMKILPYFITIFGYMVFVGTVFITPLFFLENVFVKTVFFTSVLVVFIVLNIKWILRFAGKDKCNI